MALTIGKPEQTGLDVILQGLGGGVSQGLQQSLEQFHKNQQMERAQQLFESKGYPSDLARLAASATTGGQTEVLKEVLEMKKRGSSIFGGPPTRQPTEEVEFEETETGLTPKERVSRKEKLEQRSFDRNRKYLDRLSSIAGEMPKERVALSQMKGALESGDFNSWRNAFAEMTGFEVLKSASAQVVNSAAKQFLMSSLAGLTGRPNVFIEKQITKALISPLYRDQANELIYEGLEGLSNLKEREVEIAENLEEKYTEKGKEIPRNFQKLVRQQLKKESSDFEKDYENKIRSLLQGPRTLTKGIAASILKEAKGNISLARKIAKKRGYDF